MEAPTTLPTGDVKISPHQNSEKQESDAMLFLSPIPPPATSEPWWRSLVFKAFILSTLTLAATYLSPIRLRSHSSVSAESFEGVCQQYPSLAPAPGLPDSSREYIQTTEYKELTVKRLSGAVQIETQSYDDLGNVGEDDRFDHFYKFSSYLESTFPLVYSTLELERINTHGLLYTWKGSDESLKPLVLMAHQDTVPVNMETIDQWDYEPWSGYYDGTFIHGRGASDCKSQLIATLESIQLLIEKGFNPKRTVIVSFGFDEEVSGVRSAKFLAQHILETYGYYGVEAIVDEGGQGIQTFWGQKFALPGVGEKGAANIDLTLHTPGGHSSVPPAHTGIGLLSRLIAALEASPPKPVLTKENPFWEILECGAKYGDMEPKLKKRIVKGRKTQKARQKIGKKLFKQDRARGFLWTTSQAVDLIKGGVKVNALPEQVTATVNHRIRPGSNVQELKDHYIRVLKPVAAKFNLELTAFGSEIETFEDGEPAGKLTLEARSTIDVAPLSPINTKVWAAFSGTIQHVFTPVNETMLVGPGLMVANTDTRWYWDVSKNIYRFSPTKSAVFPGGNGVHTVNERVEVDQHIQGTWFLHELIRNFDDA